MNILKTIGAVTVLASSVAAGVVAYRKGYRSGKVQIVEDSRARAMQECKADFEERRRVLLTQKGMYNAKDFEALVTNLDLEEQEEYITINEEFDAVIKQLSE